MKNFEDTLEQYEPMISAMIRKLTIYRDFEHFRQAGRVALWQAWSRFDEQKGNFTPYAYRSIQGAMLDELKKENRFSTYVAQTEDVLLELVPEVPEQEDWSDYMLEAIEQLKPSERQIIQWLFVDRLTLGECADRAGISVEGIKKRRSRTLDKLRLLL